MDSDSQNPSLSEAANYFLADLPLEERGDSQQDIYKFVRWFGGERTFAGLAAAELDNYAERSSLSDTDYIRKFEMIRTFLVFVKKKGWSKTNLAVHLKTRKGKAKRATSSRRAVPETIALTPEGHAELEAELANLRGKRMQSIDEIRTAAADKDFRENAPLDAARERRGHLEGRIIELEATLKVAVIITEKQKVTLTVNSGNTIILVNLDSNEECRYTLVNLKEADPAKGKISTASPIGKAVIGKIQGEIVEVVAPAGRLRYQIKQIES